MLAVPTLGVALAAQSIFPPPPQPPGNAATPRQVLLGKALFWDEQLSSSRTVACGTCHRFASGGSDPRSTDALHPGPDGLPGTDDDLHGSPGVVRQDAGGRYQAAPFFGIREQVTKRKAPSVVNAAYEPLLFWDGGAGMAFADPVSGRMLLRTGGALENQIAGPPVNPVEMSHIGRSWNDVANDLAGATPLCLADQVPAALAAFVQGQTYAQLFQQVYGSPGVTPARIVFAIASYERTLVADQSPFDRWLAGAGTLSLQQAAGLRVFQKFCSRCHSDLEPEVLRSGPALQDFRNIGVRPPAEDQGRAAITGDPGDRGRFKVPGLRNVALRAPYFHTGGALELGDVIDFYARGGDFLENQDPLVQVIHSHLTPVDRVVLLALLDALTDPRVAAEQPPFDRPRLFTEGPWVPSVFGRGTAGSGGLAPRTVALGPAFAGNPRLTLGLDHAAPGAFHLLAWDTVASATPSVLAGQNVYLGLTPNLVCWPALLPTQGSAPGEGYASVPFPLPAAPLLQGLTFYSQWFVADGAGPNGLTASDACGLTVF